MHAPRAVVLRHAAALVVAVAACSFTGAAPTRGLLYADGERIAVIDPAPGARAEREVLNGRGRGSVADVAWSPDGSQIAYSFTPAPAAGATYGSDIYVVQADGSRPRAVFAHDTDGGLARAPAWAPDGAAIYFSHSFSRPATAGQRPAIVQQIERLDLATGARTVVAPGGDLPALSPDGRRLAYIRPGLELNARPSLWIADADGSAARPLAPEGAFAAVWAPRFSRDGATILFTANGGDRSRPRLTVRPRGAGVDVGPPPVAAHGYAMDLWTVDVASGRLELLAALAADDLVPAWSPDGARLALGSAAGLAILDLATGDLSPRSPALPFGAIDWAG
jgi:Tol biopolymer transport system component